MKKQQATHKIEMNLNTSVRARMFFFGLQYFNRLKREAVD